MNSAKKSPSKIKNPTISVIIHTINEEKDIVACIKSVQKLADEILVVDMKSTDKTVALAEKMGARILSVKRYGYVEPARAKAIQQAKGDWIAIVDADERLTPSLIKELRRIVAEDIYDCIEIPKKNYVLQKWMQHTAWWPDYLVRFFRKGSVEWPEVIHSAPILKGKKYTLPAEERFAMIHYNLQTVDEVLEKILRYTGKESSESVAEFTTLDQLLAYTSKDFNWRFLDKEGFKDGTRGYIMSEMMRLYRLMIFMRYWEKEGYPELEGIEKHAQSLMKDVKKKLMEDVEKTPEVPEKKTFTSQILKVLNRKI
jgi:glycosyltransferase involved in cell wall biosynthesis